MAGAFKRASDKARGKQGKWTGWYFGPDGKKHTFAGTTDKATTLSMAQARESEAALVRAGLVDRRELAAREAAATPMIHHLADYADFLLAKGDTEKHVRHTGGVLARLLDAAGVSSVADIKPDAVQTALGRMDRSARTRNHALGAIRGFCRWLARNDRLKADPLVSLTSRYNEAADVRRKRRDLTPAEFALLVAAAESGQEWPPDSPWPGRRPSAVPKVSGPDRAMCYRIAIGTGFRVGEIRSLTPESFNVAVVLEASITVKAAYTKNGKEAVQPIRPSLARHLSDWIEGKPAGQPVIPNLPYKLSDMIRYDLSRAGIPYETADGVVDFHSLRGVYVTRLVESGASIKTVQELARHSTPTLTLGKYTRTDDKRKREALEGLE